MDKEPLISIIINCFNGEKYLSEALNSILNQTYKNWEVIFWDNQSKDSSANIFKSYTDKRFKYFYANEHTVLYQARNQAIKESKGEFIAFLDVDDKWRESKLERQMVLFTDNKVGLVYSKFYIFYENKKKKNISFNKKIKSGYILIDLLKNYNIGILTVIIRKEAFDSVYGFNNELSFSGDFDLVVRLSTRWKFDCIQEPLAYYRIHKNTFSKVYNVNNAIEIEELEKWIINKKITSDENIRPYLHYVKRRINFLKTMRYINEGKLKKAIINIFSSPFGFNKLKLILYIILPKKIVNLFKR